MIRTEKEAGLTYTDMQAISRHGRLTRLAWKQKFLSIELARPQLPLFLSTKMANMSAPHLQTQTGFSQIPIRRLTEHILLPRDDYSPGDSFADGTPRVKDLDFVHPSSRSKGCLTVGLDGADRIWGLMDANLQNGGTTITYTTVRYPKAIPADGPLPPPSQHVWPVFNLIPPY